MMRFFEPKIRVGNLVVVSYLFFCPFLVTNEAYALDGGERCQVKGISEKIDGYMEKEPELRQRKKSGRWIALDSVISEKNLFDAYGCIANKMMTLYKKSKLDVVSKYRNWMKVNKVSFFAPANDFGWGNIFVNDIAKKYKKNQFIGEFSEGSIIVKESFIFDIDGYITVGPLFYMKKMEKGFNKKSNNWKFVEVDLDGSFIETSKSDPLSTKRCIKCHGKREGSDFLYFINPK